MHPSGMVPAFLFSVLGSLTQPELQLISNDNSKDQVLSAQILGFRHSKSRCHVDAWMATDRAVIVKIQIAQRNAVEKGDLVA